MESGYFYSDRYSGISISAYEYKMIRGWIFTNYCFRKIHNLKYKVVVRDVGHLIDGRQVSIHIDDQVWLALTLRYSIPLTSINDLQGSWNCSNLLKDGLETDSPAFNSTNATLMDFGFTSVMALPLFMLLPISERQALIEITLFTPHTLRTEEYNFECRRISNF